jgi:hypothetical protein
MASILASPLTTFCFAIATPVAACEKPTVREATPEQVGDFVRASGKSVLTFIGYSGAEYEDKEAMKRHVADTLSLYDPAKTLVNAGATAAGIGAAYEIAKGKGFATMGIVSTQARQEAAELAPCVDDVFYVPDESWGGFLENSERLSPTSTAMVENSDAIVAIGGGEIGRDEMIAARRAGKSVTFIPADLNHEIARAKAKKKGLPEPSDFRGAAHPLFAAAK